MARPTLTSPGDGRERQLAWRLCPPARDLPLAAISCALLALGGACTCASPAPPSVPDDPLVAAVEAPEGLRVERRWHGVWSVERTLPADARALRFSPDARSVAWVTD